MAQPTAPTILLSEDQIQQRVEELATLIEQDYAHVETLHLICVLKGGVLFLADLVRALTRPVTLDFIALSSYGANTSSSGEVKLLKDLDSAIAGRDVLIIEDIVDTGLTLTYLRDILRARAPRSIRTATLLSKPSRRIIDVEVEYIGFEIEDRFVVGYGLDYDERYRNLPYIAALADLE